MLRPTRATLALCAALLLAAPGGADEVRLKSGVSTVGIIEEETDAMVRLRTRLGVTGISREFIAEVQRATPADNAALEAHWAAEQAAEATEAAARRAAREADAEAARAYDAAQRAQGLVRFEDEWISPAEADLRLRQRQQDLAAANDTRLAELRDAVGAAEARAREAQAEAERLAAEGAGLEALLAERDDTIAQLHEAAKHLEYDLYHCRDRYTGVIHGLRAQLAACEARCAPAE